MKAPSLVNTLGALSVATTLFLTSGAARAQDRPNNNGNPEEMRERMLERLRESFDPKDDAEWIVLAARIARVMEARGGPGGMGRAPGGPGGFGGPGGPGAGRPPGGEPIEAPRGVRPQGERADNERPQNNRPPGERPPGGPGGPGGFNRPADPEAEALQKAIEGKASPEEITAKLAKLRDARRAKEAQLEKVQAELRQILTARQEAVAVSMGLLK